VSQKTCLNVWEQSSRIEALQRILRIKMGHPRIDSKSVRGFFLSNGMGNDEEKGGVMHLYWRIMEELKYLGEVLIFHNPNLLREYNDWIQKNSASLALSSMEDTNKTSPIVHFGVIVPFLNEFKKEALK